jgi:hypothetical protein
MTTFAASASAMAGLRAAQELFGARPALWGHGGAFDPRGEVALFERTALFNRAPRARLGLPGALECVSRGTRLLATPAQVDGSANANLSFLGGDWPGPKVALGGTRGLPDATEIHFVFPTHSARQLVPKVDFVSTAAAERTVAPWLFTELGAFQWSRPDGLWLLRELGIGIRIDDVRERTGFEIGVGSDWIRSEPPDDNFLRALERVDPRRVRELDFVAGGAARRSKLEEIERAERTAAAAT